VVLPRGWPKAKGGNRAPFRPGYCDGLLRFAGGVPAPTRLLAVGACGRTELLPADVNRRLLTGTRATAASGLHIFFHSCHITSMRRWVSRNLLARSMPLRGSLILRNATDKCLLRRYLERLRSVTPRVAAYHANWCTLTLEANDPSLSAIPSDIFQRPCGRVGIDGAGRDRGAGR
jgi:hypothetical protein